MAVGNTQLSERGDHLFAYAPSSCLPLSVRSFQWMLLNRFEVGTAFDYIFLVFVVPERDNNFLRDGLLYKLCRPFPGSPSTKSLGLSYKVVS